MYKHLLIAWSILAVFGLPALADTQGTSKVFPLPAAETEEALSAALKQNDFQVSRTALGMGRVRLNAVTSKGTWRITLTPESALATRVKAVFFTETEGVQAPKSEDLWKLLSNTASMETNSERRPSTSRGAPHAIPSVILSRIEAVVCIKAEHKGEPIQLSGTVVSADGLILCTAHDLRNLQEVSVICYDGQVLPGNVLRADHRLDLALIHVDRTFDTYVDVADGRNLLGLGECLYSVGCPIDLGGTVYRGIVNGPPRHVDGLPLWQVDMVIHHGSSGSPVFDVQGTLVAIVKGRYRGTESIGFLIPLETVMDFAIHVDE